jgi:hypothetical protein
VIVSKRWQLTRSQNDQHDPVLRLEPIVSELQTWISKTTRELARRVFEAEEELMIRSLPDAALVRFKNIIQAEIRRRKK